MFQNASRELSSLLKSQTTLKIRLKVYVSVNAVNNAFYIHKTQKSQYRIMAHLDSYSRYTLQEDFGVDYAFQLAKR